MREIHSWAAPPVEPTAYQRGRQVQRWVLEFIRWALVLAGGWLVVATAISFLS
jgi:hypothetical protein